MNSRKKHNCGIFSRILYGAAEFYGGGAFVIINTFFTIFLTKTHNMPAVLASSIPFIGGIVDALSDPLMGAIIDYSRCRFGTKRLYILVGGIVSPIAFIAMWINFNTESIAWLFTFYLFMYILFSLCFTVLTVAHNALLPDMIYDYKLRSEYCSVRMIWSTLGSMVCGVIPTYIISNNLKSSEYLKCAIIFGGLFFLFSITTFLGTWENQTGYVSTPPKLFFPHCASVFNSHSFSIFIALYLFGQCGMDFVSGMAIYYVDDVLNASKNSYFTLLMATLLISQLIGMFVFAFIMSRYSKRFALLVGAPIKLIGTLGLLYISYEDSNIIPILAMTALIGFGNAGTLTAIFAIMPDVAEVDELITSCHRPGMVAAMATFARKISAGISSVLIGILLTAIGYDDLKASQGLRQSMSTQRGIVILYIMIPALFISCLIYTAAHFPMTRTEFDVIKKEISRRKGECTEPATSDEIEICEKVTGYRYDMLWKKENSEHLKHRKQRHAN